MSRARGGATVEVGRPDSFRARGERWPSYFLFEPWLNAGWRW